MKFNNYYNMEKQIWWGIIAIVIGILFITEPLVIGYNMNVELLISIGAISVGIYFLYQGLDWYKNNGRLKIISIIVSSLAIVILGGYWIYYYQIDRDHLRCKTQAGNYIEFIYKNTRLFSVKLDDIEVSSSQLSDYQELWVDNSPDAAAKMKEYLENWNSCWYY